MTPEQITMARALARVTMNKGNPLRRFAYDMAETANQRPLTTLTGPQADCLARSVVRFRVQIKDEVVKLARAALPQETEQ